MESIVCEKFKPDGHRFCLLTFDTFCTYADYNATNSSDMIYEVKRDCDTCDICELQQIHYTVKQVTRQNKPAHMNYAEIYNLEEDFDVFYIEKIEMLFNINEIKQN